ncbi:MAG: DUF1801 domain-containing protein [Saprospiraceae bacterium]|nr:DUF1801 domain-containing protein [Saprospiraceae bacterium]
MSTASEDFIDGIPSDTQREIMYLLHDFLMGYPKISSSIRYGIPFYDGLSWICYLNPLKKSESVELVFVRANELADEHRLLEARGRKQVKGITFHSASQIDFSSLCLLYEEALLLDEQIPYKGPAA